MDDHALTADISIASQTRGLALRSASLLVLRQGLVSLATLAGVLALSSLLKPSEFALYGYATTVMLLAAAVGDLGLGASLIRGADPKPEHLKGSLALQLSFWIPFCLAGTVLGSALGVYGFSPTTTALLFGALLLLSLQSLPTALLEREMRFGAITAMEVAQRILFIGIAVGLAAASPAQWSIPLAAMAGASIGYPTVLVLSRWRWRPAFHKGEPLFRGFSSHWWQSRLANQLAYATYPLLGGILFTSREVGLLVWALAVTSIPGLMSPMVARAAFPAMARTAPSHRISIFRPMLKGLLLISLPMVAAIFACASPLTEYILGTKWLDGVVLLKLESVTTLLGLILTTVIPLLFLIAPARRIKWIMVGWTVAVISISPILALLVGFRAISIAQIGVGTVVLLIVNRLIQVRYRFSLIRELLPGLIGVVVAVAIGVPLASIVQSAPGTLAAAAAVACIQLAVAVLLGGGADFMFLAQRLVSVLRGKTSEPQGGA